MNTNYVLYNPLAGNGEGKSKAEALAIGLNCPAELIDITKISSYRAFLSDKAGDVLIICGGDGTLNRFVNETDDLVPDCEILYYGTGTGNDFLRDLGIVQQNEPVRINDYIKQLPICELNGKRMRFINNVGFGIDGYCCEVGDELRKTPGKDANYTMIAVKGLLFHYKPTHATVTVDGVTTDYEKVWLAPTMNGRFYGGGMMPTPDQDRSDAGHKLSVFLFHGSGRLRTLMIFPQIFSGRHLKHEKVAKVMSGKEITVEFDRPRTVQVDGETVKNVKKYSVYAYDTKHNRADSVCSVCM